MNSLSRRLMGALPLLAAAVLVAQTLEPQEARFTAAAYLPRPAVTIRTETHLVEIGVVVRDNRGHSVSGLTKSDFEVRDEGKPREISAFSVQSFVPAAPAHTGAAIPGAAPATPVTQPQPRWVGMVFDDISMPPADLHNSKLAAGHFLKDGLAANDRVGVFTISGGLVLPFTSDAAKIAEAIDKVTLQERKVRSEACPLLTAYDAYLIANGIDATALQVKASEYANCSGICGTSGGGGGRKRGGAAPSACGQAVTGVQMMSNALWEQARLNSLNTFDTLRNIVDFMAQMNGTRVLLLASSGFLSGTLEYEEDQLVEKALRASVVINSLDAKGLYTIDAPEMGQGSNVRSVIYQQLQGSRPKAALNDAMGDLADSTGGLFFHNSNDLDLGFKELGMQPEVSYLLAIAPEALDSKYHRLKVTLKTPQHTTVQARKGYLAVPAKAPDQSPAAASFPGSNQPAAERRMDREVFTTSLLNETPVTVAVSRDMPPEGKPVAHFTFHLDIGKMQFHDQAGARVQRFHMIAALFDTQDRFVTGTEALLEFALKEPTYQRMLAGGFNAKVNLTVPAGSYRLRTVVVEGDENGRYSTTTQPVEFH